MIRYYVQPPVRERGWMLVLLPCPGMPVNRVLLRIFIAPHPQVSLSFINNTAQVGSTLYLRYIEQCSYFGLEESSHSLGEVFRSDQFRYRFECAYVLYVCMYVCMYVCIIHLCTRTYIHTYVHMYCACRHNDLKRQCTYII